MPKEYSRTRRIGEQIRRELSEIIAREINDPRVNLVTVTGVDVSKDMSHAKVFISSLDTDADIEKILAVLENASGYIRHQLGGRLRTRLVPDLKFLHDESFDEGEKIDRLIEKIRQK